MNKTCLALIASAALALTSLTAVAQKADPMVGGAAMYPNKTVVENATNAPNLTTLVAAVKAAGLVDTLSKPESHDTLVKILTYHVVPGKVTSKELVKMIKKGKGKATLKTVQGEELTATLTGSSVMLTDAKGGMATVTTADVIQSNGVAHVIDTVLMP